MWYRKNAKLMVATVLAVAIVAALACGAADEPEPAAAPAAPAAAAPAAPAAAAAPAAPAAKAAAPAAAATPKAAAPAAKAAAAAKPAAPKAGAAPAAAAKPAERAGPAAAAMTSDYVGPYQRGVDPFDMPSQVYDGPRPTSWSEPPVLAALVKQGKLPPLDDRVPVPDDRFIGAPLFGIGIYGGTYRSASHLTLIQVGAPAYINKADTNGTRVPWIAKSIEVSDDGRVHTITNREGHRWGHTGRLYDMEDVRFAMEDLVFNEDIVPSLPGRFKDAVTGNPFKWAAVDDLTWTMTFDSPNFLLFVSNPFGDGLDCIGIAYSCDVEYSKQFHIKYADPAALQQAMAAGNYETWVPLWKKSHDTRAIVNSPWMGSGLVELSDQRGRTIRRNPYFHAFDPEGQQLPYWDKGSKVNAESGEVQIFRTMLGEEDFGARYYGSQHLPLLKSNMVKGDYSLIAWAGVGGSVWNPQFNQTFNDDPEIGRWMRTLDFRRALSLATDREGLRDAAYLGMGDIRSNAPHVTSPFYPGAKYETQDTPADPDFAAANALLDALGLVDTNGDGMRDRLDGTGNLTLFWEAEGDAEFSRLEILNAGFEEIGITIDINLMDGHVGINNLRANLTYMGSGRGVGGGVNDVGFFAGSPQVPCFAPWNGNICPEISKWNNSDGEIGMGPSGPDPLFLPLAPAGTYPADVSGNLRGLEPMFTEAKALKALDPRQIELGKAMSVIMQEMKWGYGTVSHIGTIHVKRNNMLNPAYQADKQRGGQEWGEIYFFEDGIDNVNNPGNRSKKYKSTSFR